MTYLVLCYRIWHIDIDSVMEQENFLVSTVIIVI